MAISVCEVLLTEAPLAFEELRKLPETGAVVEFRGIVRASEAGHVISGIEYQAHGAMADHQLRLIASRAAARFDLGLVRIHHRIGFVSVGETSLHVMVGAGHRAEGYKASEWIVEEIKKHVPIWKHPIYVPDRAASTRSDELHYPTSVPSVSPR